MSVPRFISHTLYNLRRLLAHSPSSNRLFVSLLGSFLFILIVLSGCRQKTESEQNQKEVTSQEQSTGSLSAQRLREASLQGNMQRVQRAIRQGIDVNASDPAGRTALMLASYNGHYKIVQLLLKEGATVDDRNAEGRTALIRSEEHTSELQSRFDIVCRLLLEKTNTMFCTEEPLSSFFTSDYLHYFYHIV